MSADLMLVCGKRGENGFGIDQNCLFVDEVNKGGAFHDFGKLLRCYEGVYIGEFLLERVNSWFNVLDKHERTDIGKITSWLIMHDGEVLEFELWGQQPQGPPTQRREP